MRDTIDYIIKFLLHDNDNAAALVGYTADEKQFGNYRVVVRPSRFFDEGYFLTPESLPIAPLTAFEGLPLLFGRPRVERFEDTIVVDADIIAGSFFLLSRYEELLAPEQAFDEHGRFIGRQSLQARAGFIHRPIVDEYGLLLRRFLREAGVKIEEPKSEYAHIYLTHDVDTLEQYRHFRGFVGGVKRSLFQKSKEWPYMLASLRHLNDDAAYTFEWLFAQDARLPGAESICFIKAGAPDRGYDYPMYNLRSVDAQQLFALCRRRGVTLGLHASYHSAKEPFFIADERQLLSEATAQPIIYNRYHYLRIAKPDAASTLVDAGITDDFTVGFADIAGFRLGTSRAVRWINPLTKKLKNVTLHPLTAMDCSLSNDNYMALDSEQAFQCLVGLCEETKKHNGDLNFLWHNTVVALTRGDYHRALYDRLITYLVSSTNRASSTSAPVHH